MKLLELIADRISRTYIFEMAFDRKDVEARITSLAEPIVKHLVKALKWKDDNNYEKHLGDINNWLFQIQRQKLRGNRKPSQNDYYTWIFADVAQNEITISRFIKGLHRYHQLPILRTDDEVHDIIKSIIYQVSFDLQLDKFEDIRDYLK
jgi:hypothetical protein